VEANGVGGEVIMNLRKQPKSSARHEATQPTLKCNQLPTSYTIPEDIADDVPG
jgi:hypothetical protein